MVWDDFRLYVWHFHQELDAQAKASGDGPLPTRFPPPSAKELADIPWSGEGDDPLEELWKVS